MESGCRRLPLGQPWPLCIAPVKLSIAETARLASRLDECATSASVNSQPAGQRVEEQIRAKSWSTAVKRGRRRHASNLRPFVR
jgi:hypothetical protein